MGIDLNANASLLTTLCNNKKIETDGPEQSLRLRYRPAYGVRDASSLLHLLRTRILPPTATPRP